MAKKEPIYQGLSELTVQIEDNSVNSPNYFKIVNLPSEFTAGTNLIKFRGNTELFNENSEIYVEILDSNNEPVYYEVGLDEESDPKAAVVTVFINEDTAPGPAKVIICSTAYKDINNNALDVSKINVRWTGSVFIDVSKISSAEIVFNALPTVNITNSTGSYVNYGYALGERVVSQSVTGLQYVFSGRTPALITGSNCTVGFTTSSLYASIVMPYISGSNYYPSIPGTVATYNTGSGQIYTSNIVGFNGKGIAYLQTPMTFELVNSNTLYRPSSVNIVTALINYTQQTSSSAATENTYNFATVFFSGLAPQIGIVAKIRSYYKSTGVGEYILSNETNILNQSSELGFPADVVTASFMLPTIQRNDRIDFKFEFVNPIGLVSKQYVESLNNLYLGGNTYIAGDDNLLTGSLFVAGHTGTGVEITGKGNSAMVRSIGYQGFKNAIDFNGGQYSGFVIYSGSVQTILGADEPYSGVGLELVANTASYFKYASANGGMLDVKTNTFFLGSNTTFISGANGNIAISGSNIKINTPSFLLGVKGVPSASYISGSEGKIEIYSNKFILNSAGIVTASGIFVPKAFYASGSSAFQGGNIGYGDGIRPMIEPNKVFIDATNIGRCVHPSDPTEYYRYFPPTLVNAPEASSFFKYCTFHTMVNESVFTVAFHMKALIFGTNGVNGNNGTGNINNISVEATVYYIQSSSLSGTNYGVYDSYTYSNTVTIFSLNNLSIAPYALAATTNYGRVVVGRNLIQFAIPAAIVGSGGQIQLGFRFRRSDGYVDNASGLLPDADVYIKNIEVLTGRPIGLNFNNYILGNPDYSAIGAAPAVPTSFANATAGPGGGDYDGG